MIDIDADVSDPFTVSEYANEIFVNMKSREVGLLYIHTYIHTCSKLFKILSIKVFKILLPLHG